MRFRVSVQICWKRTGVVVKKKNLKKKKKEGGGGSWGGGGGGGRHNEKGNHIWKNNFRRFSGKLTLQRPCC